MAEIVVGVDRSSHSADALRWAVGEARLMGAEVVAVLVWDLFSQHHADGEWRFDPHYDDTHADRALQAAVEDALGAEAAVQVARRTPCDLPAPGLLEAAKGAALLVVGARGAGGFPGLHLGSVSQQVLHHARCPVAVVHNAVGPDDRPEGGRVLVGVDGSPSSRTALRWAMAEAGRRGAGVTVLHAWEVPAIVGPAPGGYSYDTEALDQAARALVGSLVDAAVAETPRVAVERRVVGGGPAASLLDAAEGATLIVVGRRGLGGFGRLLLGSVSDHVARHAPCPVVVMPPEEEDQA
jgi:nucleotide-binding universal stress UspA family protein